MRANLKMLSSSQLRLALEGMKGTVDFTALMTDVSEEVDRRGLS